MPLFKKKKPKTPPEQHLIAEVGDSDEAGAPGAGFTKVPGPLAPETPAAKPAQDSKIKRLAKFLILIGSDTAAEILKQLDPAQVEAISKEIAGIHGIGADEADAILAEFRALLKRPYGYSGASLGGVDAARKLLYGAFGPKRGELLLEKALPKEKEEPFDFLKSFKPEQVSLILRNESPALCAMILSRLPPATAGKVLSDMSPADKLETVKRIAALKPVAPQTLEGVSAALKDKARKLGAFANEAAEVHDGVGTLAAILKYTDVSTGDDILHQLSWDDPKTGRALKDRLYTLDDVVKAENLPLQEKLKEMDDRDVALLMRGRSPEFCQKILSNVSSQRRLIIKEEDKITGEVPKVELDAVASDFLAWFREGRENGRILLTDDRDVIV
jgi:flagellar motor switch protein FliG